MIKGTTKIIGIFGYPVEHTKSPAMHNAAFEHLGLDYCYVPFSVKPEGLKAAVDGIRAFGLAGVNITVPHKETVLPFLDKLSEEASFIGAVNTVKNENGILTGYNTDGIGFMRSLEEKGVQAKGKKVLILGAGGAARAVGYALCKESFECHIYNRTVEKGIALCGHLAKAGGKVRMADNDSINDKVFLSEMDILINTTSVGLAESDAPLLKTSLLAPGQIVCDLIYKQTSFLKEASKAGCVTMNGLGMLLWQGAAAFEIWTAAKAPVEIMRKALEKNLLG
ncbi:MAG: shikimate dehydrogenase [Nitrospirae bacterium]|nr:shikimate dehydrogenase [Nitrospirota bacterium]